jgi:glycosyltransferase involved in cell wall biosynthesis
MLPRRIRVITLTDRFGAIGGAEHIAAQIAARLDPARFESTLYATRWSEAEESPPAVREALAELKEAGVRVVGLGRTSRFDLKPWRQLGAELRGRQVDVLHAHQFGSNVWGTVIGRLTGTPVVVAHEQTWSYEGEPLRRFLDREVVGRGANAFIAVSRADARRMVEVEGVRPEIIRYIPNAAPVRPVGDGGSVREELGIGPEETVIGSVGNLRPQKAFEVLVDAAAELAASRPRLHVLIAGSTVEPEDRAALEARIAERGMGHVVRLLGHRTDVPAVIRAFDVAVCSSDFEGTPLSILEYMEAGVPIVSTRVGGVPDLIDDGSHGLLVEPRDPQALAAAVASLLDDPDRAERLARQGQERRLVDFDVDAMVRRVEDLYVELLDAR